MALRRHHAKTVWNGAFSHKIYYGAQVKDILDFKGHTKSILCSKLGRWCWIVGLCLLLELYQKGLRSLQSRLIYLVFTLFLFLIMHVILYCFQTWFSHIKLHLSEYILLGNGVLDIEDDRIIRILSKVLQYSSEIISHVYCSN